MPLPEIAGSAAPFPGIDGCGCRSQDACSCCRSTQSTSHQQQQQEQQQEHGGGAACVDGC
eukprot:5065336-Prorocentrum_lima.AAC.1